MTIAENIDRVRQKITEASLRGRRNPDDVTLIAVSKTQPAEAILAAIAAGLQHFGENRVEEFEIKIPLVNQQTTAEPIWHMIGHVQSRKAKDILPLFEWVHSVDSPKLASKFSALAVEQGRRLDVLLEVNVSGEEAKYGFQASRWKQDTAVRSQLWDEVRQAAALPGLRVWGLMTMAPIVEEIEMARPVFAALAGLRTALEEDLHLSLPELSMGMTDDYPVAIEEGATMVRIGRAIFGERQK